MMKRDFLNSLCRFLGGVAGFAGLACLVLWTTGCGGENPAPQPQAAPVTPKTKFDLGLPQPPAIKGDLDREADEPKQKLDFTGLRGVLAGKWQRVDQAGKGTKQSVLERNTNLQFAGKSVEGKANSGPKNSGKYEMKKDSLSITGTDGTTSIYGLEFLSDGEIALSPENVKYGSFDDLSGQWRRVSLPPSKDTASLGTGPIADAKRQVGRIEQKVTKLERLLETTVADRDDLAAKLRAVGVNSPADLKGNIRGQRLAQNAVKLATEIDGLERQLASLDTELLKAKSIVRRMEREEAGLSDEEMRKLAEQLREAEERTDGPASLPTTPFDVDAAVEKALKTPPSQPKKSSPR